MLFSVSFVISKRKQKRQKLSDARMINLLLEFNRSNLKYAKNSLLNLLGCLPAVIVSSTIYGELLPILFLAVIRRLYDVFITKSAKATLVISPFVLAA